MRKTALLFIMISLSWNAFPQSWLNGYSYRKKITINASQVQGSGSHSNFPVLVSLTDTDLLNQVGCSRIKSLNGYDIAFTISDGTTQLDFDLDFYDPTAGNLSAWVNIPTLSTGIDTEIYFYFGKTGVVVDPSLQTTWNGNYKGVWHLGDDPDNADPAILDATSGVNHLTDNGGMSSANSIAGKIGKSIDTDGADDFLEQNNDADFDFGTNDFTVSGWLKATPNVGTTYTTVFSRQITNSSDDAEEFFDGTVDFTSTDLELCRDVLGRNQYTGIRFPSINIPNGATIIDAYIKFIADDDGDLANSTEDADMVIYGESSSNPVTYATSANDISNRTKTGSFREWNNVPVWIADGEYRTPSLTNIVEEIISSGWTNGNAMAFIIQGYGRRYASTTDHFNPNTGDYDEGPVLVIEYQTSGSVTLNKKVADGDDDAEEDITDGDVIKSSSDLEMVNDGNDQLVGIRFREMMIPRNAVIRTAYINFVADGSKSDATSLTIVGEKVPNSLVFRSSASDDYNISDRLANSTSASVSWIPGSWVDDGTYTTPELKDIVQEIVNQSGWDPGKALTFVVSGSGIRRSESYEGSISNTGDNSLAPELVIEFEKIVPDPQTIVSRYDDTGFKVWVGKNGRLNAGLDDDATWDPDFVESSISRLNDGSWHHFVVTKHGADALSIMVDGVTEITKGIFSKKVIRNVQTGSDDARELTDGSVNTTVGNRFSTGTSAVGLRFQNLNIPSGATILSAKLVLISDNADSGPLTINIAAAASDNSTFTTSVNDVTSRSLTAASVNWNPSDWVAFGVYQSPDISNILQELADAGSINDLALILSYTAGTAARDAKSFEDSPSSTPELIIEYRDADIGTMSSSTAKLHIGTSGPGPGFSNYFNGELDEIRILDTYNEDWLITEYNNQNDPSTFHTVGPIEKIEWNGSSSSMWSNPSNWNIGSVPWTDADLTVLSTASNPLQMDGNYSVSNLYIESGSTFNSGSFTLSIGCDLEDNGTFNGGTGTIKFYGDTTQYIKGTSNTTFNNLTLENKGQSVKLGETNKIITASNQVNLNTAGYLDVNGGGNTFVISNWNAGSITGLGTNLDRYVILPDNTSTMRLEGVDNSETGIFPIGVDNNPIHYARADILNYDGASTTFDINLCDKTYSDGTCDGSSSGTPITSNGAIFTWNINSSSTNADVTLYFDNINGTYPGFWTSYCGVSHHDGSNWTVIGTLGPATPFVGDIMYRTANTTTFSPFSIGSGGPLPIELLYFDAVLEEGRVFLTWATASEKNNKLFTVERSVDGITFQPILEVKGAGDSDHNINYEAVDPHPVSGVSYYRLKQIDYDGSFEHSGMKKVEYLSDEDIYIRIFPNPSKDGNFNLNVLGLLKEQEVDVEMIGFDGRIIDKRVLKADYSGSLLERIKLPDHFSKSLYLLKLKANGKIFTQKLVIK